MTFITRRKLASVVSASALMATVAVAAAPAATLAAEPVFNNGSFEAGTFEQTFPGLGIDIDRVSAGSPDIDGWTVTQGDVDWIGGFWQAAAGTKSIDLDGSVNTAGAISQTFATKSGSTYVVTFAMSGNPEVGPQSGPAIKTMTVSASGGLTLPYSYNTTGNTLSAMNWETKTYTFVASSDSTALNFTSTTGSGWGPALDNVVITETLRTGADCKKGGWQTMSDSTGRLFRNQGDCVSYYATGEKNLAF